MKRVHYANGSFVTGDRIADALVHYASVLAKAHDADEVQISSIGPAGEPESVHLLVGPASQMMVESLPGQEDFTDDALVDDLTSRSAAASARTAAAYAAPSIGSASFLDPF